jgi:hypothetical protein
MKDNDYAGRSSNNVDHEHVITAAYHWTEENDTRSGVIPANAGAYIEHAESHTSTNLETKKNPMHFCMGFFSGLLAEPK